MPRVAAIVTSVAVALWLGAMIFLFISVQTLFAAFPRQTSDIAIQSAPRLFASFERFQLILAAVSIIAAFIWYYSSRSRIVMVILILLVLAAVGAVLSTAVITSKMELLRQAGNTASPAFRKLHGQSMMIYVTQAALLSVVAIILPVAIGWRRKTARDTAGV